MAQTQTQVDKPVRARRQAHGARARQLSYYLFVVPALLYITLTTIYPIISNLRMSFYDVTVTTFLSNNAPFVGLGNYRKVLSDPAFQHALRLSLLFTGGSLLFQFTVGFALALLFSRPFPGNGLLQALRFWLTEPNYALLSTIIANIWVGIPFNMVLLLPGLQSISPTLYEAASIDGATSWQSFRHITLPLMRPVALSVLLLGIIYTFKVFDVVYIMTRGGPVDATTVLPIYVYNLAFQFFRFGEASATAILLLLVLTVVAVGYLWLIRREEV